MMQSVVGFFFEGAHYQFESIYHEWVLDIFSNDFSPS
jgi:hypothetical protein